MGKPTRLLPWFRTKAMHVTQQKFTLTSATYVGARVSEIDRVRGGRIQKLLSATCFSARLFALKIAHKYHEQQLHIV